jgi:hypothetical protein
MDHIHVLGDQWLATIGLRADTALRHCTVFTVADGLATLTNLRPGCLSSGEQLLWQVAAWLNGRADLPDLIELRDTLDTPNWIVVRDLIADTDQVDDLMYALSAAEVRKTLR